MDSSDRVSADQLGHGSNKKLRNTNSLQKEDNDVVNLIPFSTTRQLCEDELSLIFRNVVISTQDLLNFRLVNKVWCEAATACLLQSDTSCITLQVPILTDQNQETSNDTQQSQQFSCRHKYKDLAMTQLSDLINVISNSPKFPSKNLYLYWSGSSAPYYSDYPDLLMFFQLHGSKIKTLCPQGIVSYRLLSEILIMYLPKLERLDLSKAEFKYSYWNDVNYLSTALGCGENLGNRPLKALKSLILSDSFRDDLSPLLSPRFKLISVLNVNFYFLSTLLKKDKANTRLVSGINFHPGHSNFEEALPLMQKEFCRKYPKLTELTLVLEESMPELILQALAQMNKLLFSSKDSLENLKICINSDLYNYRNKLEISPMKNLKFLTFSGLHQACRVNWGERGDILSIFVLQQDEILPEKYFPSLVNVRLEKMDLRISNRFVWLFKFKPEFQASPFRGCFPNVETLEIVDPLMPHVSDLYFFSTNFPNVRILKTVCRWNQARSFEYSLWVMCPLVVFMEIYDDDNDNEDTSRKENNGSKDEYRAVSIDMFFTGFPRDLCSKLSEETLPQHMNNPVTLNFLRITPSICHLQNLKEFKLKFLQRPFTKVVSRVTQAYAFDQMPNTKFILEDDSYPPKSSEAVFFPAKLPNLVPPVEVAIVSSEAAANADTELMLSKITPHIILPSNEIEDVDEENLVQSSIDLFKDILSSILDHVSISTNDLLTCRLVSKLWRDVATDILLQRESCYITLNIKKVRVAKIKYNNNRRFRNKFCVDNYIQKETQLSALTKLMANSPNFPASHVHIHSEVYNATNYRDYSDLLEFFRIHGSKITTLRHYGCISTQDLWDVVFIYAPGLECLDLSSAKLRFSPKLHFYSTLPSEVVALTTARPYTLTSLVFPDELVKNNKAFAELIHGLLSLPSNLRRIENVNLKTMAHILKKGKAHLIKSFEYIMDGGTFKRHYSLMKQLSNAFPKLSILVLTLKDPKLYNAIVASVNDILESSKDTLQELNVSMPILEYQSQLKIPPMKNLKSIILHSHFSLLILSWTLKYRFEGEGTSLFLLKDGVCYPKYFPRLVNVVLKDQDLSKVNTIVQGFFNFHPNQDDDSNRHYFPTVAVLEILDCARWPTLSMARRISAVFPNVRVLKINWHCYDVEDLKGNLWVMSPLVEFMEIYDVDVGDPDYQYDPTTCADKCFTGFSEEVITKLTVSEIPQGMINPETWNFLRTAPSICDLKHLKEFKLRFSKGSFTQFASQITGYFAFAQMPFTKFIISYDPERFFDDFNHVEDYREQFVCFSLIRPYAQVVCEERIDYN